MSRPTDESIAEIAARVADQWSEALRLMSEWPDCACPSCERLRMINT